MPANAVPFTCPGCGEERLVEVDRASRGWFCQVCGRSGVVPVAAPPPAAPTSDAQALVVALVGRLERLAPGPWQVVGFAPLAQWRPSLQRELTQTLGATTDAVVLVLERVP